MSLLNASPVVGCVSEEEGGSRSVKRYPQEEVINGGNEWNWPGPLCTILCYV